MQLKIMTSEALAYVKENLDTLLPYYQNGEDPEKWIKKKLKKPGFEVVKDFELDDFKLKTENGNKDDAENIKLLYTKLKELPDDFATDERLWAGLCHTVFYDYTQKRWPKTASKEDILKHYFLYRKGIYGYLVNALSRLWWIGRKTNYNNFQTLDWMTPDLTHYSLYLLEPNWTNNAMLLFAFLEGIQKFNNETDKFVREPLFNDATVFMNSLGGIYCLDACSEEFISNKVKEFLYERTTELEYEKEHMEANNVFRTFTKPIQCFIKMLNDHNGKVAVAEMTSLFAKYSNTKISHQFLVDLVELEDKEGKVFEFKADNEGAYVCILSKRYLT